MVFHSSTHFQHRQFFACLMSLNMVVHEQCHWLIAVLKMRMVLLIAADQVDELFVEKCLQS